MAKKANVENRLANLLFGRGEPDWAVVRKLLVEVDVARNPQRRSSYTWPLACEMAHAPHDLLLACVKRGMPLVPLCDPALVIERAVISAKDRNLALILRHNALAPKGQRKRQLSRSLLYWSAGNLQGRGADFSHAVWKRMLVMLLKAGADINEIDRWGRSPLMFCLVMHCAAHDSEETWRGYANRLVKTEYRDRALMLIKAGADVNLAHQAKSYEGGMRWPMRATPLFARPYGDGRLHKALLAAGADPLARCTHPAPWNAIEFAEVALERIERGTTVFRAPVTGKKVELTAPPIPDKPADIKRVIAAMKAAAAKRTKK